MLLQQVLAGSCFLNKSLPLNNLLIQQTNHVYKLFLKMQGIYNHVDKQSYNITDAF